MNKGEIQGVLKENTTEGIGVPKSSIKEVEIKQPIVECLNTLYANKIHSVPVFNKAEGKYCGFITLTGILKNLFNSFSKEELKSVNIPQVIEWRGKYLRVLGEKSSMVDIPQQPIPDPEKVKKYCQKSIEKVLSSDQQWNRMEKGANLLDVTRRMTEKHLHRLSIMQGEELFSVITQLDLVKFIHSQKSLLKESDKITVGELGLDKNKNKLHVVDRTMVALEAFLMMHENHIHGVPIVDDKGVLVGNISQSDLSLTLFDATEFVNLYLPIWNYIEKVKKSSEKTPKSVVSCSKESSLMSVLEVFAEKGIHRLFVVDDDTKPVSVITLTDVLRVIVEKNL